MHLIRINFNLIIILLSLDFNSKNKFTKIMLFFYSLIQLIFIIINFIISILELLFNCRIRF